MTKPKLDIKELEKDYLQLNNLHKLAKKYHTSHIRISKLFKENGINIQNIGKRRDVTDGEIKKWIEEYDNGLSMEQLSKKYGVRVKKIRSIFRDYGVTIAKWRNHIKKEKPHRKVIPKKVDNREYKVCPYCGWKSYDVKNIHSSYAKHILKAHGISAEEHLTNYPEDKFYFSLILKRQENKVQCMICGKWIGLIDDRHLMRRHNITKLDYIKKYPNAPLISKSTKRKLHDSREKMLNNPNWERFSSSYEKEIQGMLNENNVQYCTHDRKILKGFELEFLIGNVAIEFNGNQYHSETFGRKDKYYHYTKYKQCENQGIRLIQIFEDEYVDHKEQVNSTIKHALMLNTSLTNVNGRDCSVVDINDSDAISFYYENAIMPLEDCDIWLGAFKRDEIVGVMGFKHTNDRVWELTNYISNIRYKCRGVGGKIFSKFVSVFHPLTIKGTLDLRWGTRLKNNLYLSLGFKECEILEPQYKYYCNSLHTIQRFTKNEIDNLGLSIGLDKIWDCGYVIYEWNANEKI